MVWELLFWLGLAVSLAIGFVYFRDLGDVAQMVLRVKRANMVRFIRHEYRLLAVGLAAAAVMALTHFIFGAGVGFIFWIALLLNLVFYAFPYVWVHVGLRNQQETARYFSIEEAREFVAPANGVIVVANNGFARAHPDAQIMRPHLAGDGARFYGENVVMTYCAVANLGLGYRPVIDGETLDLEVLAQHGNNLILRDNTTGEPIQQILGFRDRDGPGGPAMAPWPTFRMTFRGFQKAYPEGRVYLNPPPKNPLLRLFDLAMDTVFTAGIMRQHREAKPIMNNMSRFDDRLPNKTYVWGINIGEDAVCYTDDFVIAQGPVNATVGGRALVLAWDQAHESLGAWYNDSGAPVASIDFFGRSDKGDLARVEVLKPGLFWHVWAEFFPATDINRVGAAALGEQAARAV